MNKKKLVLIAALLSATIAFFLFDVGSLLSLETLRDRQAELANFVAQNFTLAAGAFFVLYVMVTALSIPGAAVMTLAAGAVFGLLAGTLLVSFASSIGATLAFLISRFLLRDYVEGKFSTATKKINQGVQTEGGYYLFTLRLVPLFPFFVINLAMGVTRLNAVTFYWVSQLGMLPGTVVFVNAGTQLGQVSGTSDILSPTLIGSFALLGVFPLLARKAVEVLRNVRSA